MAEDRTSLLAKELRKTPQAELGILNAEDIVNQGARRDPVPAVPRPQPLPGRKPLFRN